MPKLPPLKILETHTRTILDMLDPKADHIKFCGVFEEIREVWKKGYLEGIDDTKKAFQNALLKIS